HGGIAMKPTRLSIARLMGLVALAAVNTAAARALSAYSPEILIGVALPGLAVQAALFRLVGRRRRGRAFWLGFAALAAAALASFVPGLARAARVTGLARPGAPITMAGPPVSRFWLGYGSLVDARLSPWLLSLRMVPDPRGLVAVTLRALVWSLPQLSAALV